MQARISWSSAPRLAGFEILILATPAEGSSTRTFPEASSVEDNECVAFGDRLAFLALDLLHRAVVLGLDGHLHLHRLEDHERVALLDRIADLAFDLPHGPGDVGLDVWQLRLLLLRGERFAARYPAVTPEIAVVVSAYNEADRLGETLEAVLETFPGARVMVADDFSSDATPQVAEHAGAELVRADKHLGKGGANTLAVGRLLSRGGAGHGN